MYTRRKFGARPGYLPRALDVDNMSIFSVLLLFLKYHSSPQRLGSHCTTTATLARISLCDSHERCFCECACVCACVSLGSCSIRDQEQSQERLNFSFVFLDVPSAAAAAAAYLSVSF